MQAGTLASWSKNPVSLEKKYQKKILNYGDVIIYEYRCKAADVSPHFLNIIIKEKKDDNPYGENYNGFVICSDGISWKNLNGFSIPIFNNYLEGGGFVAPLFFDGKRFIPVGMFPPISKFRL